jgi:hypothetical protein
VCSLAVTKHNPHCTADHQAEHNTCGGLASHVKRGVLPFGIPDITMHLLQMEQRLALPGSGNKTSALLKSCGQRVRSSLHLSCHCMVKFKQGCAASTVQGCLACWEHDSRKVEAILPRSSPDSSAAAAMGASRQHPPFLSQVLVVPRDILGPRQASVADMQPRLAVKLILQIPSLAEGHPVEGQGGSPEVHSRSGAVGGGCPVTFVCLATESLEYPGGQAPQPTVIGTRHTWQLQWGLGHQAGSSMHVLYAPGPSLTGQCGSRFFFLLQTALAGLNHRACHQTLPAACVAAGKLGADEVVLDKTMGSLYSSPCMHCLAGLSLNSHRKSNSL